MILMEQTVLDFINQVDSNQATPGGGSVSALAASLGVSLGRMVGHLTVPKKAFKSLSPSVQESIKKRIGVLEEIKERLIELVDEDTAAYNQVMQAFKLPKNTVEEKAKRSSAIQEGTLKAIKVPYEVALKGLEALSLLELLVRYGNKNAISDLGVGTLLLQSAIEGALFNVDINLGMLKDQDKKAFYSGECARISKESLDLKETLIKSVKQILSNG